MKQILQVQNLEKVYGRKGSVTKVLKGISFEINQGEFVGIMGSSGSGKTTLLNCVSTIDQPTSGMIKIDGQDLTSLSSNQIADFRCKKLGFIFQDYNLLDILTAYENIALALTISGTPAGEIDGRIKDLAQQLGITDILQKYPIQMSGGQRQRVASVRALITNPALVLADEPTGALDSKSGRSLLECFRSMVDGLDSTILMVTHDPFSASYCDRILFIRDGKLFTELVRGEKPRKEFFDKVMEVMSVLGGETA